MNKGNYLIYITLIATLIVLGLSFSQLLFSSTNEFQYSRFFLQIEGQDENFKSLVKQEIQKIAGEAYALGQTLKIYPLTSHSYTSTLSRSNVFLWFDKSKGFLPEDKLIKININDFKEVDRKSIAVNIYKWDAGQWQSYANPGQFKFPNDHELSLGVDKVSDAEVVKRIHDIVLALSFK